MKDTRRTIQAFLALQENSPTTDLDLTTMVVQLAATTPAILYIQDLKEQQSIFLNRRIFAILGYSPEEESAEHTDLLQEHIHPDDLPRLQEQLQKFEIATDDDILTAEYRIRHRNGKWRWLSCRSVVFQRDSEGKPIRILNDAEDVTDLRQTEYQLRDNAALLQAVLDTVVDAIVTINEKGAIETFNHAAESIFGYKAAEVIGLNVNILMPAPYHEEHDGYLQHYLTTGERQIIGIGREVVGRRKDGTTVPLHLAVSEAWCGRRVFTGILHDLSAEKETQAHLRESETRLKILQDNAPVSIYMKDREGRYLLSNRKAEVVLGVEPGGALGKTDYELFPNEYADTYFENDMNVIISASSIQSEEVVPLAGGARVFLSEKFPMRNDQGEVYAVCGISSDITEQKRAVMELREQETKTRQFSERLQAMLNLANDLSRIESINDLCHEAIRRGRLDLGFDRLSLWFNEGEGWIRGSWGTDEQGNLRDERGYRLPMIYSTEMGRVMSGESTMYISSDCELHNGANEPVGRGWHAIAAMWDGESVIGNLSADNLLHGKSWTEHDGELLRLFASHLGHLCSRKRLHNVLIEREERFRSLVDNLPMIIWMSDETGKNIFMNQYWRDFISPEIEAIGGADWKGMIHPDDCEDVQQKFLKATRDKQPYMAEYRRRFKDDRYHWISSRGVPRFSPEGAFLGLIGFGLDVTDQKVLQEQLFESQKLESMGQLAGGIAHDFNNLLTAILGYVELSLSMLPEDEKVRPFLENVSSAAGRAAELTKQLLMYARRQMVEFSIVDINQTISNMVPMLRRIIGEQYDLSIALSAESCCVNANVSQMEQVLTNLVVNARDAMPNGGRIAIETSFINLDSVYAERHIGVEPGEYVLYSVSDTGTGMTAEVRNRIFEPFFTTKEVGKGTGLGLATCYGIVKQSRGNIWVYSEPGKGTTFKVYLPRVPDEGHANKTKLPDNLPAGTETVLVVDDEPMVRDIAARTLREQGYRVLEASNGAEALHIQSEWPGQIDLLITDVVMPLMGGKELVQRLQEFRPAMRVLYMSGYTQNVVLQQGVLKPGVILLTKPFTARSLLQKTHEALTASV